MLAVPSAFSLFTAYQILSPVKLVSAPENENTTISIMCVLMALRLHDGNDRDEFFLCLLRIKFWVLNFIFKRSWQSPSQELQYNTCRRRTKVFSALCCLIFAWPHSYHLFSDGWPHVAIGVLILCSRRFSSLFPIYFFSVGGAIFERFYHPKARPHDYHSALGFDHIFDHKQIRSTRRQDVTRVWKSRFCVAERARKSKNG